MGRESWFLFDRLVGSVTHLRGGIFVFTQSFMRVLIENVYYSLKILVYEKLLQLLEGFLEDFSYDSIGFEFFFN